MWRQLHSSNKTHFTILLYSTTTPHYTLLYYTTPHYTIVHYTTQHHTTLHNTPLHSTPLHTTHIPSISTCQAYDLPKANKSSIKVFKNRNIRNFHGRWLTDFNLWLIKSCEKKGMKTMRCQLERGEMKRARYVNEKGKERNGMEWKEEERDGRKESCNEINWKSMQSWNTSEVTNQSVGQVA